MTHPTDELVTVINLISMPPEAVDGFLQGWAATTAPLRDAPGFRGTRLLRALSPDDPYQVVNVAQWDTLEQWETALSEVQPDAGRRRLAEAAGIRPQHFFYRVVSVTDDPSTRSSAAADPHG